MKKTIVDQKSDGKIYKEENHHLYVKKTPVQQKNHLEHKVYKLIYMVINKHQQEVVL